MLLVSALSEGRADDLIFDIGMHIGQDTEVYLKKGFRVVAVEALLAADLHRLEGHLGV